MVLACPHCGSRNLRYSHLSGPVERLASLVGLRPIRCRDCRQRFNVRMWSLSNLSYARCPKCLSQALSTWSPSHYHVPLRRGIALFFGGNAFRCDSCRHNFVSFRPRKRRKSRSRAAEPVV